MTENLKSIVQSVNKALKSEYNLISFDSQSEESLIQVLLDIFVRFNVLPVKYDIKENDPEETNKTIMECLMKVQYTNEDVDIAVLRRGLVRGDKKIIYPILQWIFDNEDLIIKLAYLAKYLLPLNLPPEALSISEVINLYGQYDIAMEEFKDSHKNYEFAVQEGKKTRELRSDSTAIEGEIENVKKRIERLQSRLDKIPQQELLLEAAKSLRIEKDQQKELQSQIDEQKLGLQRVNVLNDRLQKECHNIRLTTQGTSPNQMLEAIIEETQVLEFMVKQKLPQELLVRQTEVQILEEVIDEPNITREYLSELQYKVDDVNKELQKLLEVKMNDKSQQNDALGLGPFRQQAAMIARNKEGAAEQLDQFTKELNEVESQLKDKQQKLQDTVGEVILRGDDLKQFVNTLRAKSNIYKQQRSEIASIKAEANDLTETLDGLKAQDPSLALNEDDNSSIEHSSFVSRPESPVETRGITELSRLVEGLTRAVLGAREKLSPLSQQMRPLRERIAELKDECDSKKQNYDALNAQLSSETASLQAEYNETEMELKKLEQKWQDLKMDYDRSELLLEKAREEMRESPTEIKPVSLKETLNQQIREQENTYTNLRYERDQLQLTKEDRRKQIELWTDLSDLFELKKRCFMETKRRGIGGTMSITKTAETFTLQ